MLRLRSGLRPFLRRNTRRDRERPGLSFFQLGGVGRRSLPLQAAVRPAMIILRSECSRKLIVYDGNQRFSHFPKGARRVPELRVHVVLKMNPKNGIADVQECAMRAVSPELGARPVPVIID